MLRILFLLTICSMFHQASAQTPGGVAGAAIWLKANTGVTTGATFTWADQSGNSRNGTQSTAANQPTVTATSINYNPALLFDGTNDRLVLANLSGLPTGAAAVEGFSVARNLNTAGSWMHLISYGGSGSNTFFTLGKQQLTANAIAAFNTSDAISSALEYASGNPALTNGKYTGTQGVISSFGLQRATITFTGIKATTAGRVGCDPTDASFWNGNIAETILFPTNLSAANAQKVNSYLAIKYGITLDQTAATNYLASDASVVWNGTTNSTNKANIAGIGRDDSGGAANTGLVQKQSKSVNTASSGDLVAMGLGTIATNNAGNANAFSADKSFLIWGDNAGANAWQTTESPSLLRKRLTREWKVQETGTVGNVVVRVQDDGAASGGELPVETGTVYLLVDADGDFSAGATEYAMTLTGTNWDVTVDLTDGQYFTFATQVPPAPGGVAGAVVWLKADANVYSDAGTTLATNGGTAQQWNTQVGTLHATQTTAADKAIFRDGTTTQGMNFNPAIEFVSNDEYHFSTNLGVSGTNPFTITAVTKQATMGRFFGTLSSTSGNAYEMDVASTAAAFAGSANIAFGTGDQTDNRPHISTTSRSGNVFSAVVDEGVIGTGTNTVSFGSSQAYDLGSAYNNAPYFVGSTGEFIVFGSAITAAQLQQVNSYLAIKYGITLDQTAAQNYTASDGTTVFWNGTTNSTYKNNIAGIARDDVSGLNQKQSKSVNAGLQVVMGNGGTIAASNILNGNAFSADKSALLWGNDAGAATWTTTGAPTDRQTLVRKWKVQETGTVGNVKIQVADNSGSNGLPAEATTVYLLTDADGNFASGATETAMTLNGTNWEASIDLTNGQFFTFATLVPPVPGGVGTNLVLWYEADDYNTGTGAWPDQSTAGNNGTTNANGTETISGCVHNITGTIVKQTAGINFNTSLTVTDVLRKLRTPSLTGPRDVFVVSRVNPSSPNGYGVFGTRNSAVAEQGIRGSTTLWNTIAAANVSDFIFTSGSSAYVNGTATTTHNNLWHVLSEQRGTSGSATDEYYIGGYMDNNCAGSSNLNRHLDGDIAEVIVYNTANNTATNRQKIESYLAIKYGITKAGNYLASDGTTTTWTSGAGYDNEIAGIGQDIATALLQKQSASESAANTVSGLKLFTLALGNSVAASNAANPNTLAADNTFLVWGATTGTTAFVPAITAPAGAANRMNKVWKATETKTVGNATFRVPLSLMGGGSRYLVINTSDATFSSGNTFYPLTVSGSYLTASVDLTSRANSSFFFTFAQTPQPGPGGVTANGYLWFKSDASVYADGGTNTAADNGPIQEWQNNFPNANVPNIQQTGTSTLRPTYRAGNHADGLNFNPTVSQLPGTWMKSPSTTLTINQIAGSNTNVTTYTVFKETVGGGGQFVIADHPTSGGSPSMIINYNGLYVSDNCISNYFGILSNAISTNPKLFTTKWGGGSGSANNKVYNMGVDVALSLNNPVASFSTLAQNYVGLGYACGTAYPSDTKVNEVVVYSGNHDDATRNRVESYLATKWGFTLGTNASPVNYTASNGTTVFWTGSATFQNDIVGIGTDDLSGLEQKQSASVNATNIVSSKNILALALGNFAVTNEANGNSFAADRTFLVCGSNGATTVFGGTVTGAGGVTHMNRIWLAKETATVGMTKFRVPISLFGSGTAYMYISNDGATFSNTDQQIALTPVGDYYEASVDLTSRANTSFHFTFAELTALPVTLTLNMTATPATVTPTAALQYVVTLANTSANTAYNVKIKDQIPAGVNVGTVVPSIGTWDAATKIWTVPSLGPSPATATLTINTIVQ